MDSPNGLSIPLNQQTLDELFPDTTIESWARTRSIIVHYDVGSRAWNATRVATFYNGVHVREELENYETEEL